MTKTDIRSLKAIEVRMKIVKEVEGVIATWKRQNEMFAFQKGATLVSVGL
jgi:hypothetical protein